jgi:hypothetical protein
MLIKGALPMQTRHGIGSLLAIVLIATGALLPVPDRAAAEMMVVVGSAEVLLGETGFLDVSFEITDETYWLAAYQIELNLTGPDSGVRFTGFAEPASAIFPGQVALQTEERPTLPGPTAAANDILLAGENLITDGAALLRVLFETDPDSLGVYHVTVDASIERTNFSNGLGALIPIDEFVAGAITVVPESSSLLLLWGVGVLGTIIVTGRPRNYGIGAS